MGFTVYKTRSQISKESSERPEPCTCSWPPSASFVCTHKGRQSSHDLGTHARWGRGAPLPAAYMPLHGMNKSTREMKRREGGRGNSRCKGRVCPENGNS